MAEKVSTLVLTVELDCCRCYKKIKKILCKFDEIQDQVYDEKQNTVTITGYFCPHKLKKKLCCAGDIIKCIQIKESEPEKTKPKPPEKSKPKPPEESKPSPKKEPEKPKKCEPPCAPVLLYGVCCGPCHEGYGGGPCSQGCGKPPPCAQGCGKPPPCSQDCGRPPPCSQGCGKPPPCSQGCGRPPPCYQDCGSPPPCYCGCGGMRGYVSTCKFYVQEDPATCVIM